MRRRQELFLDAVEESVLMVEVAYERLVAACVFNTMQMEPGIDDLDERGKKLLHNELLSQAWLVVDAANRLRVSATAMPGLRRTPAVESMLRAIDPVLPLRNYIQHLDGEASKVASSGRPLWGTFQYLTVRSVEQEAAQFGVVWVVPGRIAVGPVQPPFRVGSVTEIRGPIDHIVLAVGGVETNLTKVSEAAAKFGRRFDAAVAAIVWPNDLEQRARFSVDFDGTDLLPPRSDEEPH